MPHEPFHRTGDSTLNIEKMSTDLTITRCLILNALNSEDGKASVHAVEESFKFMCKYGNLIRQLVDKELKENQ